MKIIVNLLKLSISFLVFLGIFGILITKLFNYVTKKIEIYDKKILLDKKWSKLTKIQLQVKEKELLKKITIYSLVEVLFLFALIVTFWYCYIAFQNNANMILAIIVFILEVLTLVVLWVIKRILKQKRYKYITFIDKKMDDNFEN